MLSGDVLNFHNGSTGKVWVFEPHPSLVGFGVRGWVDCVKPLHERDFASGSVSAFLCGTPAMFTCIPQSWAEWPAREPWRNVLGAPRVGFARGCFLPLLTN